MAKAKKKKVQTGETKRPKVKGLYRDIARETRQYEFLLRRKKDADN